MNRPNRRRAEREMRKLIKSGTSVSAHLAGFRIVRADGTVKIAVGRQPDDKEGHK